MYGEQMYRGRHMHAGRFDRHLQSPRPLRVVCVALITRTGGSCPHPGLPHTPRKDFELAINTGSKCESRDELVE